MLVVETVAGIRREHFIRGKMIKEIALDSKVSRNTVRKVLRSGETRRSNTSVKSNLDRSSGNGPKSSTRCWRAMR
jgi:DNA invertase Pin-like site-specific DNA recombinase